MIKRFLNEKHIIIKCTNLGDFKRNTKLYKFCYCQIF